MPNLHSEICFLHQRFDTNDLGHSENEETFPRTPGQIDRDRILYSGHFLRLAEVTQTISPVHGYVFHNRLSHSLKVGQVSRRLCERLKRRYEHDVNLGDVVHRLDPDVCEAVGLAHDLGHPPFGHSAETELNEIASINSKLLPKGWGLQDAFEGNAQSFRIVCRLAGTHLPGLHSPYNELGLNLCRQTLNGILKYPYLHKNAPTGKKWGAYEEDKVFLDFARKNITDDGEPRMSLEAEIMDWADDITFAVHDLLDFYASGNIPIYLFLPRFRGEHTGSFTDERNKFIADVADNPFCAKMVERAQSDCCKEGESKESCLHAVLDLVFRKHLHLLDSRYTGTNSQRRMIGRITFEMIEECLGDFKLEHDPDRNDGFGSWKVVKESRRVVEIELLKQFTWHYIIRGQQLQYDQIGQGQAIRLVFKRFIAEAKKGGDAYLFPRHVREDIKHAKDSARTRLVVDYVSSMSEPELMRIYRQMIADNGYRH